MTKLTVPKMIDLIRQHHQHVPNTTLIHMLSNAQEKFVRRTKNNIKKSVVDLDGQTVVGETEASPLSLLDEANAYLWQFYKDGTVDTVMMKANANVMFMLGMFGTTSAGAITNDYSIAFNRDASVEFYDEEGARLTDFVGNTDYLTIFFVKVPTQLVMSQYSSPDVDGEFIDGIVSYVIGDIYASRTDMAVQEKLMMSKHYKNIFEEAVDLGKRSFNMAHNDLINTMSVNEVFQED